jgi:uroporphyrin-III C-methyltransferase/precorrin-2 dehydrogenase/sirohydrochlorin ferrochelatase
MASFPIFVDVIARPPLVVGGGDLALAKVRVLLLRAPVVDVVAHGPLASGFTALIADGHVAHSSHNVTDDDLRGRPLVISANTDDKIDGEISARARAIGVPINIPDRPQLSTFSLAAIVDRGTATVAIGTEGAAPVLATRLRAELEQQLHPRLGRLADIAREYRGKVAAHLPAGASRRTFWESLFGGSAGAAILAGDEVSGRAHIEAMIARSVDGPQQGRVILVGAGPGDPELMTLKAVRALKSADVVVHDGLMGDGVLAYARREAQLVSVAKSKGRHARTQAEINALLVALARGGKIVVRLKGGDPSIFGRGGEEIDMLRASGIDVEVVPGITAATAVAASLQIPLTHRDISRSVTFLSGHAAGDGGAEFDQVDFAALANGKATLVVYMGLSTSAALAARLIEAGWPATTPVLAVARATQAGERRIATTLDGLIASDVSLTLSGPTLLIIGEVASLDVSGVVETFDRRVGRQKEKALANA